jgi:hypothetical protein
VLRIARCKEEIGWPVIPVIEPELEFFLGSPLVVMLGFLPLLPPLPVLSAYITGMSSIEISSLLSALSFVKLTSSGSS